MLAYMACGVAPLVARVRALPEQMLVAELTFPHITVKDTSMSHWCFFFVICGRNLNK